MMAATQDAAMHQLLYASSTSRDCSEQQLEEILTASRRNNPKLGVTGMLLYCEGGFMQVLEGTPDVLASLYARIAMDKRHWNARILLDRQAPRTFGDWSMGFRALRNGEPADAAVFEITRNAIENRLDAGEAPVVMTMLATFYRVQTGMLDMPKTAWRDERN
jgi:hypothetical protein